MHAYKMPSNKTQRHLTVSQGFTLVEIAIVLVIIGLLLGGVLKGQELINSAKVRSLNDKISGVTAAWYAFQDRYQAKPGDYSKASTTIKATLSDGTGNGAIQTAAESAQVWAHLAASGMINGNYSSTTTPGAPWNCTTDTCPDSGFGSGFYVFWGNTGRTNTGNANELRTGRFIPSNVLAELDRKTDDGLATTGTMQLSTVGFASACLNGSDYETINASEDCIATLRAL